MANVMPLKYKNNNIVKQLVSVYAQLKLQNTTYMPTTEGGFVTPLNVKETLSLHKNEYFNDNSQLHIYRTTKIISLLITE